MCVEGDVQSIVAILGDVEHTGAEIFGSLCSLEGDQCQHQAGSRVRDGLK